MAGQERGERSPRPEYLKSKSGRVLLLVGLPGSGKSTIASKLREKGWWVVCQDHLGSKEACVREMRRALDRGKSVVIDRYGCNQSYQSP